VHAKRTTNHVGRLRPAPDPRLSRSLEYGLTMLECFAPDRPALGVAEMAQELGLGRSTAHRYARTLVMLGYLEQDRGRKYRLAAHAHGLAMAALDALRLSVPARDVLEQLREWTGHTVTMAVLHDGRALYLQRLLAHGRGQHRADLDLGVGASVPLHCSALGKSLLAALTEQRRSTLIASLTLSRHGPKTIRSRRVLEREVKTIKESGLAFADEELAPGVRAIAAPLDACRTATPIAAGPFAVEVTAPASRASLAELRERVGPLLARAVERIGQATEDGETFSEREPS
jgi:IclR family transcriptional regulator, pca regulon regulatory protein